MLSISISSTHHPTYKRLGIFHLPHRNKKRGSFCKLAVHSSSLSLSLSLSARIQPFSFFEERREMGVNCKFSFGVFAAIVLVFAIFLPAVRGQGNEGLAPAPAPTSDGTTIDQGIACGLMLLALVLTYIIHTFDAPSAI